ncbi:hypothetical protein AB0F71_02505 [Kitasatospora sp. NPDC028055]|uniref:hypothetical protein n=1 Tax=Kitasatospora sp. NPDC028055 TaxID=3155653 RepID=UPI0033FFBEEA
MLQEDGGQFDRSGLDGWWSACQEWAEHLTAWVDRSTRPDREAVVQLLAQALHQCVVERPWFLRSVDAVPLSAVAAAVAGDSEAAREAKTVLAAHQQATGWRLPERASVVGDRRRELVEMLRARPDGGLLAALAGDTLMKGRIYVGLQAVVADLGPASPPAVHLTLFDPEQDPPSGASGPDGRDDSVLSVHVTATGPGVASSLYTGCAYDLLLAALPGLDYPAEMPLGHLLGRLLTSGLVIGVMSPTRAAVMFDKGVRALDAEHGWWSLLVELETEPGQAAWAGPALYVWQLWARLRALDLARPPRGHRSDVVLPRAAGLYVVAPDGTRSYVRVTASRRTARPAPSIAE